MIHIDVLITNANVLTLDGESRRAGSVAVTNGRISGIWSESEPLKSEVTITSNTEVINLNGATLMPGFIDTHTHLSSYGLQKNQVNCGSPLNKSISHIQERIVQKAADTSEDEWILGYGYDDTLLADHRHPNRKDLDAVAPHHPVYLRHISGHFSVVNSKALEQLGIKDTISDPQGGHFGRDHDGKLDGVLHETANNIVSSKLPLPTEDDYVTQIGEGAKDYLAQGITTANDAAIRGELDLSAHLRASREKVNPLRMRLMIMHHLLQSHSIYQTFSAKQMDQYLIDRSNGQVRLDSAKMFQDGSIQGLTGALRKPYHLHPDLYGDFIFDQPFLNQEVAELHQRGYRLAIHGNGDRAIGSILDAYELALQAHPRSDHRHRIEHVQTATIEDLDRMQRLNVAGSFFINHVYYWGDRHKKLFLGPERTRRISPLAEAVDRDLLFTLHSDCPVTPVSPLFSIWAAVNRVTRAGEVLGPEQKIDVETALRAMTIYGAKLNFDEAHSGSVEIGKQADFVVLAEDPIQVNPMDIKDIPILKTIIDGKIVYES